MTLIDPLAFLYYAWIPNEFRETYKADINNIFDKYKLNKNAKALINTIQTKMKQKKLTDDGKEQKERIITKYFINSRLFC